MEGRKTLVLMFSCVNWKKQFINYWTNSIYLSKQWDKKKANDRDGMRPEKQLCLPSWLSGTENPHHILCVGLDQYRITIVQCCSISPTAATCETRNRADWTSGWDSHCFHHHTPCYKPLKVMTDHSQTLKTNKEMGERVTTCDKWMVKAFESTNPLRMVQLQCWERSKSHCWPFKETRKKKI